MPIYRAHRRLIGPAWMFRSPMYFVKTHYGAGWKCRSFPDHRETYCQGLYVCMLQVKQTASRARVKKPTGENRTLVVTLPGKHSALPYRFANVYNYET